jgi:hypothetical protein
MNLIATPPVVWPLLARSAGLAGPGSGPAFRATHSPHQPWPAPSKKGSFVESPLCLSHLSHTVSDQRGLGDCDCNIYSFVERFLKLFYLWFCDFLSIVWVEKETSEAEEGLLGEWSTGWDGSLGLDWRQYLLWARLLLNLRKLWSQLQRPCMMGGGSWRHDDEETVNRIGVERPKRTCYSGFQRYGRGGLGFLASPHIWSPAALRPCQRAVGGERSLWTVPRISIPSASGATGGDPLSH